MGRKSFSGGSEVATTITMAKGGKTGGKNLGAGGKVGKKSRGKGGGRTRGPKGARDKPRKLDKASLDDDLDSYMMRDRKVGTTKLNEDLDDYFKNAKKKAEEEEVKEAPAAAEEKAK